MCGRYALYGPKFRSRTENPDLADRERVAVLRFLEGYLEHAAPRYNIAPQQGNVKAYVPIVRRGAGGELEIATVQWWLLPAWSKAPRIKYMTFNARIETVAELASFREPFRRRRCLIPASGWYEWQELAGGNRPWYIRRADGEAALFAGVWDRWVQEGQVVESCAIIIGPANEAIGRFHDRMPYTVSGPNLGAWLDPALQDSGAVARLLEPFASDAIAAHRVSKRVNAAKHDDAALLEPESA